MFMTTFGKVLLGLMLVTAAVLVVRGHKGSVPLENPISTETASTTPSATTESSFSGSMNDLIARGGDYKCTFDHITDVSHSVGTVVISGKKLRGDFESEVKAAAGMKVGSHMISDGEFMYTWSDMSAVGMKIAIAQTSPATQSSSASFDYNQKLDYSCTSTTPDTTLFNLPANITFNELKK
jgi:hypothetical protein